MDLNKIGNEKANQKSAPFILPELPYAPTALEPHLSSNTFSFHHGKHHNAYVTNLNGLVKDKSDFENLTLEEIILKSAGKSELVGIFNNAAQIWNHSFYWHSMKQNGGGKPSGKIADKINSDFGSFENFAAEFKQAGATQFGSGWAWLVVDTDGKLKVTKTANADLPMTKGQIALITADVWEHAYYLDFQNRRPDYLNIFLEHLVNWDFANENLNKAM
ncbi:MAG: superoxide dismutase [Sphingobacteriia bacterium]|nr:superoxide dismutase [Sphingobacteriia bacterium]